MEVLYDQFRSINEEEAEEEEEPEPVKTEDVRR